MADGWRERDSAEPYTLGKIPERDNLNHEIFINLLRRNVKDERVVQLIKRYLKSGVMENGVVMETEEGSPQGENLSPLLENVYLNEFDQEYLKRGVSCIRYRASRKEQAEILNSLALHCINRTLRPLI